MIVKGINIFNKLILISCLIFFFLSASCINEKDFPQEEKIRQFLTSLHYSALDNLKRDNFYIELKFQQGVWIMRNIFLYDQSGKLANKISRSGTCAGLSQLTYDFIKPLLEDDYKISFLKGNEDLFFRGGVDAGATHYVINISPKDASLPDQRKFIIDPSYKTYKPLSKLKGYTFSQEMKSIDLFEDNSRDLAMKVGMSYPLLLLEDKKWILSLAVKKVDGQYDKNNFALAVFANKKESEVSDLLFTLMLREGEFFAYQNKERVKKILSKKITENLSQIILSLFKKISFSL